MKNKGQNLKKNLLRHDPCVLMDRAVELAWKGKHRVEPNPMVGAVFVKNGRVVSEGYHHCFGEKHAESMAIDSVAPISILRGSTLYVTLEPCCHQGKQPPCIKALIDLELKKIFYAALDPNPKVAGKGIAELESSGISTELFPTFASRELNGIYFKNVRDHRPYVHLKNACTLTGKISLKRDKGTRLMNPSSFDRVHLLRSRFDAILIGVETLLSDDPQLTARIPGASQPIRIVLDSRLRSPRSSRIFHEPGKTVLATTLSSSKSRKTSLPHATVLPCRSNEQGQIDLHDLLKKLFQIGIRSILVEGGERINTSFLRSGLVDQMTVIFTPHLTGPSHLPTLFASTQIRSLTFEDGCFEAVGDDHWIRLLNVKKRNV